MIITSNTKGKLEKIRQGDVFADPLVFVTEFLQNSYRARAKNVNITIGDGKVTFSDDGVGLKKPEHVLTLDLSNWESTDEGFGIGIWSMLAVPELESVEIVSGKWLISLSIETLFNDGEPKAKVEKLSEKVKGFTITLKSEYFNKLSYELKNRIIMDAELQVQYKTFLNGVRIPHKDLFGNVKGDFVKEFSTQLFIAKLAVNDSNFRSPMLYYEKREVMLLYNIGYVTGVVEMKSGALNLREPDRRSVTRNEKWDKFIERLNECVKELYKEFVKSADNELIDQYAEAISNVLNVCDYEKWILVEGFEDKYEQEERNIEVPNEIIGKLNSLQFLNDLIEKRNNEAQLSLFENNMSVKEIKNVSQVLNHISANGVWVKTGEACVEDTPVTDEITPDYLNSLNRINIGGVIFEKKPIVLADYEQEDEVVESNISISVKRRRKRRKNIADQIRDARGKAVWVKASETESYSELRSKAEYYKVRVFVAKNVLHEKVYQKYEVPYITEIEAGVKKTSIKKDVCLKTKKEEAFIGLLQPICQYYNLAPNTFKIGTLAFYVETRLGNKIIDRRVMDNKDKTQVYGVTDGKQIILDRKALGLKRFNISKTGGIGIHEIKALMANMATIRHELAHVLYGTEDNTIEHYEKEQIIEEEIVNLYLSI